MGEFVPGKISIVFADFEKKIDALEKLQEKIREQMDKMHKAKLFFCYENQEISSTGETATQADTYWIRYEENAHQLLLLCNKTKKYLQLVLKEFNSADAIAAKEYYMNGGK